MATVIFAVDESGAKGYSDNHEQVPGEFGVVAGVLVPEERRLSVETETSKLLAKYETNGKLHITDLSASDQEALRSDVFRYLLAVNARWTYEAMYVEGLRAHAELVASITNKAKLSRRSKVKISANERKDLLHTLLLGGAFGKAVAFCCDYVGYKTHLDVITDQLDPSILKAMKADADRLLNAEEKQTRRVTGYDPEKKEVVEGFITSEICEGLDAIGDFSEITYEVAVSDSPLTVVADVIANSVHHHLLNRQNENLGSRLNTIEAISGHMIAPLVYGVTGQESNIPQAADTIFSYPVNLRR